MFVKVTLYNFQRDVIKLTIPAGIKAKSLILLYIVIRLKKKMIHMDIVTYGYTGEHKVFPEISTSSHTLM